MVSICFQNQYETTTRFLQLEMGQNVNRASRDKIPINLNKTEVQTYIKRFGLIDKDKKGFISINDIRNSLKVGCLVIKLPMPRLLYKI